jgi:phage gp29-like protein
VNLMETVVKYIERLKTPTMGEQGKSANSFLGVTGVGLPAIQDDLTGLKGAAVYSKMRHDPDIKAAMLVKTAGVLSNGWEISPGKDKDEPEYDASVELADFVKDDFGQMQGSLDNSLKELLRDALSFGVSIEEWNWRIRDDGKIGLASIKCKDPAVYSFKTDEFMNVTGLVINSLAGQGEVDLSKFGVLSYQSEHGQPWGVSDLRAVYRYWMFKEAGIKWWGIYLEKYGSPTAKGNYKRGLPKAAQDDLLNVLKSIQQETAIVVPDDVTVELMEAMRGGQSNYLEFLDFCVKQMVKAILGQTLATEQGTSGTGSYAQAKVHLDTMILYIRELKQMIEEYVNEGLIRRMVDYNYPVGQRFYPNLKLRLDEKDIVSLSEVFFRLTQSEIVMPDESWVREYLGLPEREEPLPTAPPPVLNPASVLRTGQEGPPVPPEIKPQPTGGKQL